MVPGVCGETKSDNVSSTAQGLCIRFKEGQGHPCKKITLQDYIYIEVN